MSPHEERWALENEDGAPDGVPAGHLANTAPRIASRLFILRRCRFFWRDGASGRKTRVREAKKPAGKPKNGKSSQKPGHPTKKPAILEKTAAGSPFSRPGFSSARPPP